MRSSVPPGTVAVMPISHAARIRIGFLLVVATGCSAGGASQADAPASTSAQGSDAADSGEPLVLTSTPETQLASRGTVTLEDGGTITATAGDGTTFELVVPADAVPGDVEITLTPLSDVGGIDADSAHAVLLEPDGLEFNELARLTITPVEPIPLENQLMFEAAGDGQNPQLALIDPTSEAIVILIEHFSVAGIATASEAQAARFLEGSAANAEARLGSQVRARIGQERYRQLTGEEPTGAIERQALNAVAAEYQREVLDKRRAAAGQSCRALQTYVDSVGSWERQWQLTGMTDEEEAASQARITEAIQYAQSRKDNCEKEAIAACQEAGDHKILVAFWQWIKDPVDTARAKTLCGQDYRIDTTFSGTDVNNFITYEMHYTGTKCGGHVGDWVIDFVGPYTGGGDTVTVIGTLLVQIPEGATTGTAEGTWSFVDVDQDETTTSDGRFSGTATFTEDPAALRIEITSGLALMEVGPGRPGANVSTFSLGTGGSCD